MANCIYCGQPSGFLRRRHSQCAERHDKAITEIPRFFRQVVDSPIAPERFSSLLKAAADNSFLKPEELRTLCVAGVHESITQVLKSRPMSTAELRRITELTEALAALFPDGLEVDEMLAKAGIINDLAGGHIPDRVSLVGPMPIDLDQDETVLWVFNNSRACRVPFAKDSGALLIDPLQRNGQRYFTPDNLQGHRLSAKPPDRGAVGDLVLTDKNIYFLQADRGKLIVPLAMIDAVRVYAEGVHVDCKPAERRTRLFILDDAWLAANVLLSLVPNAQRQNQSAAGI